MLFNRGDFVPLTPHAFWTLLSSIFGLAAVVWIGRMIETLQQHRRKDGPLSDLVENSGDFMGIAAPDGTVTYLNRRGLEMVGLRGLQNAVGRKVEEFVVPEFRQAFREEFLVVVEQGKALEYLGRLQHFRQEDRLIEVDCHLFPIHDPKTRSVTSVAWSARDVTEKRRRETERSRLAAITESSPDAIVQVGNRGQISTWNHAAKKLYGYNEDEVKGQSIKIIVSSKGPGNFQKITDRLAAGEVIPEYDTIHRRKDGSEVDIAATFFPFFDDEGKTIGAAMISRDVSERKRIERELQESEARFRASFERAPIGVALADADFRFLKVNQAFCDMLGYSEEELLDKTFLDITHPEDVDMDAESSAKVFRGEIPHFRIEKRYIHKSGEIVCAELSASIIFDEQGNVLHGIGMMQDITKRKKAEGELEASRRLAEQRLVELEQLYAAAPVGLCTIDRDLRYVRINENLAARNGKTVSDHLGRTIFEMAPRTADFVAPLLQQVFDTAKPVLDVQIPRDNSDTHDWLANYHPQISRAGEVTGVSVVVQDVSHLKETERQLEESRSLAERSLAELDQLYQTSPVGLVMFDRDLRYVRINERLAAINGKPVEEHIGRTLMDIAPDAAEQVQELMTRVMETGEPVLNVPLRIAAPAEPETVRDWELNYYPAHSDSGEIVGVGITVQEVTAVKEAERVLKRDRAQLEKLVTERTRELAHANQKLRAEIAERNQAEKALRKTEQELTRVISSIPDSLWSATFNAKGNQEVHFVSPVIEKITGHPPESLSRGFADWIKVVHPADRPGLEQAGAGLLTGETSDLDEEYRVVRKDGSICWVREQISAQHLENGSIQVHGIISDITARKFAEAQRSQAELELRQSQKLKAVGVLAGGIAHDFNNILTAISNYTYLSSQLVEDESKVGQNLAQVLQACERAGDLVKQILTFSREGEQPLKPLHISSVVKEALKLVRASIPSSIDIRQSIDPECGSVLADLIQIQQIVINLCTNSYQSIGAKSGVLEVRLEPVSVDAEFAAKRSGLKAGDFVCLTVRDTGGGIDPELQERIFEPFFTTKQVGEGTGLGLSVVHGIVTRHDGSIFLQSTPGLGSTFQIYLPRLQSSEADPGKPAKQEESRRARVLFVDDEKSLVETSQLILQSLGYEATALTSSAEALERFRKAPHDYDLVISDITMPEYSGIDLARLMLEIRPDLPIILVTGYSQLVSEEKAAEMGVRAVLLKPYRIPELAEEIKRALPVRQSAHG